MDLCERSEVVLGGGVRLFRILTARGVKAVEESGRPGTSASVLLSRRYESEKAVGGVRGVACDCSGFVDFFLSPFTLHSLIELPNLLLNSHC